MPLFGVAAPVPPRQTQILARPVPATGRTPTLEFTQVGLTGIDLVKSNSPSQGSRSSLHNSLDISNESVKSSWCSRFSRPSRSNLPNQLN